MASKLWLTNILSAHLGISGPAFPCETGKPASVEGQTILRAEMPNWLKSRQVCREIPPEILICQGLVSQRFMLALGRFRSFMAT